MRPGNQNQNQNKRLRGRSRNKGPNPLTRTYESNGPDVKVRGTALHIAEKYVQLARDAHSSSDPVMAENYYQHAEHYYRIIAAAQAQSPNPVPFVRDEDFDDDYEGGGRQDYSGQRSNGAPYAGEPGPSRYNDRQNDQRPYNGNGNGNGNGHSHGNGAPAPQQAYAPAAPAYTPAAPAYTPPGLGPQPGLEPQPDAAPQPDPVVAEAPVKPAPAPVKAAPAPVVAEAPVVVAEPAAQTDAEAETAAAEDGAAPRRRRSRGSRGRGRRTDAAGEDGGEPGLPLGDATPAAEG